MPGTDIKDYWRRSWGIGDRKRVGFYKGQSVVKSHGDQIIQLGEAGESSLSIAKKLQLKQQTVNDAINSIEKGLAGENYKFSKPFKDITKSRKARTTGWINRKITPDHVIRERLVETGKIVQQHNGKFIFADVAEQAAFDDALDKRYSSAKTSRPSKQAGVLSNAEIYDKFLKHTYSEKSVKDLIWRHKKANDFEYSKLSEEQKVAHKEERKGLLKNHQVKRISGTRTHQAHHLYSLGDEFDVRTKDIVIIPKKVNARLGENNKALLEIANERIKLLSDVNVFNAKNIDAELKVIDAKAEKVINEHYKKFPQDNGLLKYRKINAIIGNDGSISFAKGNSIGGDSSKWIHKDMGKNINKLDKNELKIYRDYLLKKAKIEDLRMIEGVDTADKLKTEKTSSRTKPQIFARKILDKGQGIWKMLPGKNFRVMPSGALAATDFALMSLMGMPFPAAMASASGWFGKADVGKAAGLTASNISFMDEMNQKKAEEDRIKNALAAAELKKSQETAKGINLNFELEEDILSDDDPKDILSDDDPMGDMEKILTGQKLPNEKEPIVKKTPTYGLYADQIKNLKV